MCAGSKVKVNIIMTSVIKKIYYFFLFSIICTLIYTGCVPPQEDTIQSDLSLNLQDITLQHIFDLQDKRLRDSLYTYFHHSNPAYRYQSVLAFGSIKDSLAIDSLAGFAGKKCSSFRLGSDRQCQGRTPLTQRLRTHRFCRNIPSFQCSNNGGYW